jgi:hypothetical protein
VVPGAVLDCGPVDAIEKLAAGSHVEELARVDRLDAEGERALFALAPRPVAPDAGRLIGMGAGREAHQDLDVEVDRGGGASHAFGQWALPDLDVPVRASSAGDIEPARGRLRAQHDQSGVDQRAAIGENGARAFGFGGVRLLQESRDLALVRDVHAVSAGSLEGVRERDAGDAGPFEGDPIPVDVEEDVAAGDEHAASVGPRRREEIGQDQVEQGRGVVGVSGEGEGREYLALRGVCGEASAVAAAVDDEDLLTGEERLEG